MSKKVEIHYVDIWEHTTVQEIPDGMNADEFAEEFLRANNYLVECFERASLQAQTTELDTATTSQFRDIEV